MAKLYFRYGAMGSSKTANALMVRYNYEEKGQYAVILKPRLDKRDGAKTIYSRIGLQAEGEFVETFLEKVNREWMPCLQDGVLTAEKGDWNRYAAVIVDEAQFLTADQADLLSRTGLKRSRRSAGAAGGRISTPGSVTEKSCVPARRFFWARMKVMFLCAGNTIKKEN